MPSKEENARNGLPDTDWRDAQYDMLYLPVTETVRYHYDFNGNRTATALPDGRQINYLHRPGFLRTARANPRLDNRRRRKPPTNPLLPLRPHRHPKRDDR
ncbi:hypothetical protein HMPREF0742_02129 [Rothia aeria F0184]|uniref:RHS repeat-associated core domain protein n=1 Tax=Rothia aeria F0184 TaxID=888019 RepID=U7V0F0_9MICC|nr:hypothetical protein HMPREF0742_02129 [Rothia aeria F0184]